MSEVASTTIFKIVFESRRLADSKKKGDDSKSRRNREKEQKTYENDAGEESLSLRSDGCAMGAVGTLDSSAIAPRTQALYRATRSRECHPLRAAQWVSLAHAAS